MVSNVENLNPQVLRHIGRELQSLKSEPMEGITVVLDEKDMTSIEAVIDGPADTPYYGGKFRVRLTIGQDFPQGPPKGFFLTKIFHPNVGARGEICVNTLKRDWKSDLGLKHVLLTIKCLLIVPNPESALNEEAGKLLLERYDDYCTRAKIYTEIHAKPKNSDKASSSTASDEGASSATSSETLAKKACNGVVAPSATDKKALAKKEKNLKDKKKTLKRL